MKNSGGQKGGCKCGLRKRIKTSGREINGDERVESTNNPCRSCIDKALNKIDEIICFRLLDSGVGVMQKRILDRIYFGLLEPLFKKMYRMGITTRLPLEEITADRMVKNEKQL